LQSLAVHSCSTSASAEPALPGRRWRPL